MSTQVLAIRAPTTGLLRHFTPPREDATSILLLALPLVVTFLTLDAARWITEGAPLTAHVLAALLLLQAPVRKIRSPARSLLFGSVLGVAGALSQAVPLYRGEPQLGMASLLLVLAWWTALLTLWLAHRQRGPVLALIPGMVVLLISLAFLPLRYQPVMLGYLLIAALPLAHLHARRWRGPTGTPRLALLILGAGIAIVGTGLAWRLPSPDEPIRPSIVAHLEGPLLSIMERGSGFFSTVPNRRDWPVFVLDQDLPFTGPVAQGSDILMLVESADPLRWRMRVYEVYGPEGWSRATEATRDIPYQDLPTHVAFLPENRSPVEIRVRTTSSMDLMATAGEPLAVFGMGRLELSPAPRFHVDLTAPQDTYLPSDLHRVRAELRTGLLVDRVNVEEAWRNLTDRNLWPNPNLSDVTTSVTLERQELRPGPRLAVQFDERRSPPRRYRTIGSVSTATPEQLRAATPFYPQWIRDRYLQLPVDFPASVKGLAREVTVGQDNVFDVAQAIEQYLQQLPYSTDVVPPPPGIDGVEWFLTVQRVGFCQYYASAMITMLRSLGIPARLVTGFAPGDWDDARQAWVVRARHYHAWPEVYFPGYGWVEFEPTPSNVQTSLRHLGLTYEAPVAGAITLEDDALDLATEQAFTEGDFDEPPPEAPIPELGAPPAGPPPIAIGIALVASAGTAAAVALLYVVWRLFSRIGTPQDAFGAMQLLARLAGLRRLPHETPSEFAERLVHLMPRQAEHLRRMASAYNEARYSRGKDVGPGERRAVYRAWQRVRAALLWRLVWRGRPQRRLRATALVGAE